jgi:hypothetical protein
LKLSREKVLQLSHLLLAHIEQDDGIEYFDEPQHIRQHIARLIESELKTDELVDAIARRKIESQKRAIPEGSDEWDVLYRKYYEEELTRHRRVMP